ncbi:unnamed protein product [Moneuplotes crassus]|uniref:ENTH domain-containing protein n=1 Tax=Euplotes crassus TaxID=5936 RepID=A0AAD1U419_EUPCR|nr:unnamed protein product [Moneuplotes crassus]
MFDSILKSANELKNKVLRKTELEIMLEEATNSESWNVPNTTLEEISEHTEDWSNYNLVMKHLWETIKKDLKYHVNIFKGLHLMEFLIKNGNTRIVQDLKDDILRIRSLQEVTYHQDGMDKCSRIREKAKSIVDLISDPERLDEERKISKKNKGKFSSKINSGEGRIIEKTTYFGNYEDPSSEYTNSSKYDQRRSKDHGSSKKSKKKKKNASSSNDDSSEDDSSGSSSEDEKEKKKKKKSKKKSKKEKDDDDIFGLMTEDSSQNTKQNNAGVDIFGENFGIGKRDENNDIFATKSSGVGALPKPPQKSSMAMGFESSGQQNFGINSFGNMGASSQIPPLQPQTFCDHQQTSTSSLDAAFGQMTLNQQTQFQPQSTSGFGAPQNTFGANSQFQSSGTPQQFQQTSGFGGGSTGIPPPSSDIFGSSSTSTGGFGHSTAPSASAPSSFGYQQTSTQKVKADDGFGAFQSSEKDAWSMGEGLVNLGNIKKKGNEPSTQKKLNLFCDSSASKPTGWNQPTTGAFGASGSMQNTGAFGQFSTTAFGEAPQSIGGFGASSFSSTTQQNTQAFGEFPQSTQSQSTGFGAEGQGGNSLFD